MASSTAWSLRHDSVQVSISHGVRGGPSLDHLGADLLWPCGAEQAWTHD